AGLWCCIDARPSRAAKFRTRRLVAQSTQLVMATWLLWIVNSKTSFACFFLASGLMVATSFSPYVRRPVVLLATVASIVSVCFPGLFLGVGGGALEALGRNSSLTGRTDIWRIVLKFAVNPLFGAGYESFWLGKRLDQIARALNISLLNQAHNGYIEVYLN